MSNASSFDLLFFAGLPYAALAVFFVGIIYRYFIQPFTFSSLSSQFLENEQHFWTENSLHFGIITVLCIHLTAFLFPGFILSWNIKLWRLFSLEVAALIFGLLAVIGFVSVFVRRLTNSRPRKITSTVDWLLYGLLLVQASTGVYISVFHPWGYSWFSTLVTPYLRSLIIFQPEVHWILAMPWFVKLHILNAMILIGFFPFTRLAHILVAPIHYYWRKPQVVRWYR